MGFDNAGRDAVPLAAALGKVSRDRRKFVLDAASKEFKSRSLIFVARPGEGVTERQAARQDPRSVPAARLPAAGRRRETVEAYVRMFELARERNQDFEPAVFFALRTALVSPRSCST
jgi:hypothetical protein